MSIIMRILSCLSTRTVSPKIMCWLSLPRICYPSTQISVWSQKPGLKNLDTWNHFGYQWLHTLQKRQRREKRRRCMYVPILKHRLLRHSTTHLAGNKKNNSNSSSFVVNQSLVIQSYLLHCISPTISSLQIWQSHECYFDGYRRRLHQISVRVQSSVL